MSLHHRRELGFAERDPALATVTTDAIVAELHYRTRALFLVAIDDPELAAELDRLRRDKALPPIPTGATATPVRCVWAARTAPLARKLMETAENVLARLIADALERGSGPAE